VKQLLESNADVNVRLHKDGSTPLYSASWNGHADISLVKLLLEHGANANVRCYYAKKPIDAARQKYNFFRHRIDVVNRNPHGQGLSVDKNCSD